MGVFAYTYVLQLTDGRLYVGSTSDLKRRMQQHHSATGGRTTALHPGQLVYYEACLSLSKARNREQQLKT